VQARHQVPRQAQFAEVKPTAAVRYAEAEPSPEAGEVVAHRAPRRPHPQVGPAEPVQDDGPRVAAMFELPKPARQPVDQKPQATRQVLEDFDAGHEAAGEEKDEEDEVDIPDDLEGLDEE